MFTGIIEEIGKISKLVPMAGGLKLQVSAVKILDDIRVDDSLAVNGVCLTVTQVENNAVWVDAVGTTLKKTTVQNLREQSEVNLERALRLSDRLGGHLVQGHVNGVGEVTAIRKLGENYYLEIFIPDKLKKYIIAEGSIAIEGVSLTVAEINDARIGISVIPHTWHNTTFKTLKTNQPVNIETDVLAKYIENFLKNANGDHEPYSETWFNKLGYSSGNNTF